MVSQSALAIGDEASLEVRGPDGARRSVPLDASPFLIGRGGESGNHLQLTDPRISRRCCAVTRDEGGWSVEDRGHQRGIFLNGQKVQRARLRDGDVIAFGLEDSFSIVFCAPVAGLSLPTLLTRMEPPPGEATTATAGLHQLNVLLQATSLLHSDLPLDSVLNTMLDHAIAVTKAERGLLLEADAAGALAVRLARGAAGVSLAAETLAPSQTILRRALATQTGVITEDLSQAEDALQMARSIVGQALRAVVAIPLYARSLAADAGRGALLGALYLDSRRAAAFSQLDRQVLEALAREAASILDNARLVERERQRQRLEQELQIARDIQQALIPHGLRDLPYCAIAGVHQPCHSVGGDYFDVFPLDAERTALLVADVSGKGLGAALLSTMLQGALSGMSLGAEPLRVFGHINRFLCDHAELGKYATMFFGILHAGGRLDFINAGHPSPMLVSGGQAEDLLTEGSFPLGLIREADYVLETKTLRDGDTLVLFSDGVSEAMDLHDEPFGLDRLRQVLSGGAGASLTAVQNSVLHAIAEFSRGAPQADDITLLLVRYRGAGPAAERRIDAPPIG